MNATAEPTSCLEFVSPIAVRNKLSALGIPDAIFVKAAQRAFVEKANFVIWRYAVREVRQQLDREGFRLDDPNNLPLSVCDSRQINVTVSSGDQMTGVFGHPKLPKSKNIKGAMFLAAIDRNLDQDDLFPDSLPENIVKFGQTLSYPTWVFLVRITEEEIFAEFSLPSSMDAAGHIDGWSERILIEVPLPDEARNIADDLDSDAIDIVPKIINRD